MNLKRYADGDGEIALLGIASRLLAVGEQLLAVTVIGLEQGDGVGGQLGLPSLLDLFGFAPVPLAPPDDLPLDGVFDDCGIRFS